MEMKDYLKYLHFVDDSRDKLVYYYNEKPFDHDKLGRKTSVAISGLYSYYQKNGQKDKIAILKNFIDMYGEIARDTLFWPDMVRSDNRESFERSAKIICSKFEKVYDCAKLQIDTDFDKELRKL